MAELKLRNCPFCGKKAEVRISLGRDIVSCTNCHAEMAGSYINIDSLIEEWNTRESPIANRWIPCSERLPEDRDNVLTYDVDGHVRKCEYDAEFKKFRPEFTNYYAMEVSYVTHWMPLPEPPEKE